MFLKSHYSIKGAAAVMGIGTDNCFMIPSDPSGRMIPEALEKRIVECKREGKLIFKSVAGRLVSVIQFGNDETDSMEAVFTYKQSSEQC